MVATWAAKPEEGPPFEQADSATPSSATLEWLPKASPNIPRLQWQMKNRAAPFSASDTHGFKTSAVKLVDQAGAQAGHRQGPGVITELAPAAACSAASTFVLMTPFSASWITTWNRPMLGSLRSP